MDSAKKSYVALAMIGVLGILPLMLRVMGLLPSTPVAVVLLIANLAACLWAFSKGPFGWFWVIYAVGCVATFVLAGMTSPIELAVMLLTLPVL